MSEFKPGSRILVFLTRASNKAWLYYANVLGLSLKFDIIKDEAILTHQAAGLVPITLELEDVLRQI